MDDALYNPYIAFITGKDEAGQKEFFERFYKLSDPLKDVLTAPETTAAIKELFTSGVAPAGYEVAVAKIVMFAALGDVPHDAVLTLLTKLGLSADQAARINAALVGLFEKINTARAASVAPKKMPEIQVPPLKPLAPLQKPGSKNVIDLRKQP